MIRGYKNKDGINAYNDKQISFGRIISTSGYSTWTYTDRLFSVLKKWNIAKKAANKITNKNLFK